MERDNLNEIKEILRQTLNISSGKTASEYTMDTIRHNCLSALDSISNEEENRSNLIETIKVKDKCAYCRKWQVHSVKY